MRRLFRHSALKAFFSTKTISAKCNYAAINDIDKSFCTNLCVGLNQVNILNIALCGSGNYDVAYSTAVHTPTEYNNAN